MTDTPVTTKTPRWMKIVLPISLAINLGIAGVIGGAMLRAPDVAHDRALSPEGVATLARAMPMAYQHELRKALRDQREALRSDRQALTTLGNRFIITLNNDPFDIGEVEMVFEDHRALLSEMTGVAHDAIIDQIILMSPEDRQRYTERLRGGIRPNGPKDQN